MEEMEEDTDVEDTRGLCMLQAVKDYSIKNAIHNFADAWKSLKMSTLANAWKKLLFDADVPVVDFTGFETSDFINNFRRAGNEVSEENLEEWLNVDEGVDASQVLTDAEIVDSVLQPATTEAGVEDEATTDGDLMSLAQGRYYCDELLRFVSQREPQMPKQGYEQVRIIRHAIIDLQHGSQKQLKIDSFFRPKTPTPPTTPVPNPVPSTSSAGMHIISDSDSDLE